MYEQQRDQLLNQQFNIDQTAFVTENLQDTVETVFNIFWLIFNEWC